VAVVSLPRVAKVPDETLLKTVIVILNFSIMLPTAKVDTNTSA